MGNEIKIIIPIVTLLILYLGCSQAVSQESQVLPDVRKISMDIRNQSLEDIVRLVSRQTGFKITVDNQWVGLSVSGNYKDVDVGSFFRRVLKGQNLSILYDDENKEIIVRMFGTKDLRSFIVDVRGNKEAVDQISSMKLSDIKVHKEKEAEKIQKYYANPKSIDQMSGMTFEEIARLRERETREKNVYFANPDAIDQMSGITLEQINELRAWEAGEIKKYLSDSNSVDQMSGMLLSDVKALREREALEIQEYYANPNSIDQMSGLTFAEIAKIREREKKILNQ